MNNATYCLSCISIYNYILQTSCIRVAESKVSASAEFSTYPILETTVPRLFFTLMEGISLCPVSSHFTIFQTSNSFSLFNKNKIKSESHIQTNKQQQILI